MRVSLAEAQRVAEAALLAHGASVATARSTARSIVAAEAEGNRAVGFAHLVDYLEALDAGRIDGAAAPVIAHPTANVIQVDACANLPHEGVDAVTTDPEKALAGTLLPFGGRRGANIALMVELLAAGLTGGNWSARAPAFNQGAASPGVGLFIMAVNPIATNGPGFTSHLRDLMEVLTAEEGIHIPGIEKTRRAVEANALGISVQKSCWDRVFKLC